MKKVFTVFSALLLTSALFFSCQKNSLEDPNFADDSKTTRMTFKCTIAANADSKVSIDNTGKTEWQEGDAILIHGEYVNKTGYSVIVTLDDEDISADKKTATISFDVNETATDGCVKPYSRSDYSSSFYAVYPADAVTTQQVHCYYNTPFDKTNKPLLLACDDGSGQFVFENLCCAISFTLPAGESYSFDEFAFTSNNGETISYSRYSATLKRSSSGSYTYYNPYTGSDFSPSISGESSIITCSPVVNNGTTENFIYIPGSIDLTGGFTIIFKKDGVYTKQVSTKTDVNLVVDRSSHRYDYLPLGDISGHLKDYHAPSHSPADWAKGAEDLTGSNPANSYIVYHKTVDSANAGKAFKIRAYKGNTTESVGAVASVSILWETYCNSTNVTQNTVIANVDYDADYIYFQMPDSENMHAGNALIAAKNLTNDILWSWHIWVPAIDVTTSPISAGGVSWMPCNLGAIVGAAGSNGLNYGLLYQWGRPSPRVGLDGSKTKTAAKTYPASAITTENVSDYTKSIDDIIQHPTVFYVNNHNWFDSATSVELWSTTKTKYDPCPAGWRVAPSEKITVSSAVEDTTNGGFTISGLYFPATGSYSRYGGAWMEGNCYIWSCDTYTSDSAKYRAKWYMFKDVGETGTAAGFGVKEYKTTTAPVRCVAE